MARYEFSYTTPTPAPTDADPNAINQVPTSFALGGISPDVAKGIRFGLMRCQTLGLIANVDAGVITESRVAVTGNPGT